MASKGSKPRFRRLPLGRPWCEALELADGRRMILRPIEPGDDKRLQRSFQHLTPEEIRFRFLHPVRELTDEAAHRLTHLDPEREFALVLVEARPPQEALIGAVARVVLDDDGRRAEFAITVGREIACQGLASYLLGRLIEWCRKKGLEEIHGDVLSENRAMLKVARRLGFQAFEDPDVAGVIHICRPLRSGARD